MQGKVLKLLGEALAAQKGRLILWLPVMLGAGSALYFALPFEPPGILSLTALAGFLLAAGLIWPQRQTDGFWRVLWTGMVLAIFLAGGFAAAQLRTAHVAAPMLAKKIPVTNITGTVASIEVLEDSSGQRLVLTDLVIEDLPPEKTPYSIRLKIRDEDAVTVGTRVSTLGSLNPPSPPVLPGAFDFQRFAYFRQLGAFGFSFQPLTIVEESQGYGFWARMEQTRQDVVARLMAQMKPREAAISSALMIGERAAISDDENEAMRVSGLAHMLSISGMHVGLLGAVVFFAVRFLLAAIPYLALRYPIKKYAAVLGLLAAAGYTILAVPSTPSYRALLMTGFILTAVMLDRKPFSMRTIGIAALCVLVYAPESVWSASFQMSFAATAALIFFFEETAGHWTRWRREAGPFRRGLLYVAGVCATTVVASLATTPFAIYHFQQFAVYSMLANLLAVPVLSFIVMPSVIIAFLLMPFGWEYPALWVMEFGVGLISDIAHQVALLPHAQVIVQAWPLAALLLFSACLLALFLWAGAARKWLALAPAIIAVLFIVMMRPPDILVSPDGGLTAVRMDDGRLSLSSARKDKFTAEIWLRHMGYAEEEGLYWPREGEGPGGMMCDPYGCRITRDDRKIAFSQNPESLHEDCAWADVVISKAPLREVECRAAVVIDRFDVWRKGAHALWLEGMRLETVKDDRGVRPWTVGTTR